MAVDGIGMQVGRQLGDLEEKTQSTVQGDLQQAIMRLMETSAHAAAETTRATNPAAIVGGGTGHANGGADGGAVTGAWATPTREELNSAPSSAPFTIEAIPGARSNLRRPASAGVLYSHRDKEFPPMGKGVLPTTVFLTGATEAPLMGSAAYSR